MRRALDLAISGRGKVEPNPLVGCVIVRDGTVIAGGYHQQFGGPHAERVALADLASKGLPSEGATAYVTLEPCCHTNKKTPPCVPALIEAKLKRVVVGCLDPNPAVSGSGVAQLRAAGIDVTTGVLEGECKQLNAPFFARILHHRPYVTLKWAQSADGKVAGPGGQRRQISNPASMRIVHGLRARSDAILVGINTVLIDDPLLTARNVKALRPLHRVVLDSVLRLPLGSRLVKSVQDCPLAVYCTKWSVERAPGRVSLLSAAGVNVISIDVEDDGRLSLKSILNDLASRDLTHVVVETGPTVAASFFELESGSVVDRLWIIRSPRPMNEPGSLDAPRLPDHFVKTGEVDVEGDCLTEYLNPASQAYFAPLPSADFTLVMEAAATYAPAPRSSP